MNTCSVGFCPASSGKFYLAWYSLKDFPLVKTHSPPPTTKRALPASLVVFGVLLRHTTGGAVCRRVRLSKFRACWRGRGAGWFSTPRCVWGRNANVGVGFETFLRNWCVGGFDVFLASLSIILCILPVYILSLL